MEGGGEENPNPNLSRNPNPKLAKVLEVFNALHNQVG